MWRAQIGCWVVLMLSVSCAWAEETAKTEDVAAWIKDLGSDEAKVRVAAQEKLLNAGEASKSALEKAQAGTDATIKSRAQLLLNELQLTPLLKKMRSNFADAETISGELHVTSSIQGRATDVQSSFKTEANGKRFILDTKTQVNGQVIPSRSVSDGATLWMELTVPGKGKLVQKYNLKTFESLGAGNQNPITNLQVMCKNFSFLSSHEGKVGDSEALVLEGPVRDGVIDMQAKNASDVGGERAAAAVRAQMELIGKTRIYLDKKTMQYLKSEVFDKKDNLILTTVMSNVKAEAKLQDADLKYSPPEGARVLDMEELIKTARARGQAPTF